MQETWVWSLVWEDPLEEGMANHSSILARRILWTEEPGGPLHRVSKNWTWLKQLSMHNRTLITGCTRIIFLKFFDNLLDRHCYPSSQTKKWGPERLGEEPKQLLVRSLFGVCPFLKIDSLKFIVELPVQCHTFLAYSIWILIIPLPPWAQDTYCDIVLFVSLHWSLLTLFSEIQDRMKLGFTVVSPTSSIVYCINILKWMKMPRLP